ncbi:MAG: DUF2851 family protein, partial [Chloroflexota bacterium]|nr:DUF2851 family protein [Chloroflexota bacterium]
VWQAQWFVPGPLRTTDGRTVVVRYRGRWSAGFGPDFADAQLILDGREITGAVEIHRRAADWRAHGHHLDPAYNAVALHVVLDDDGTTVRTREGRMLPTLALAPLLAGSLVDFPAGSATLGGLGDTPCARDFLTTGTTDLMRVLGRAGDERLALKAAAMEARFAATPPGDVLYAAFLDALGYSANRAPMATLAAALPLHNLEQAVIRSPAEQREQIAAALLLGTGGFLDPPPSFVLHGSALRDMWRAMGRSAALAGASWETARVRPTNHPARRLLALAALLADGGAAEGLIASCLAPLLTYPDEPRLIIRALRHTLRPPSHLLTGDSSPVGADRAGEIAVNVVLPFALIYGLRTENELLVTAAERAWDTYPATRGNSITRAMTDQLGGPGGLRVRTGRLQQGLIALYNDRCKARMCAICPVTHLMALTETQ